MTGQHLLLPACRAAADPPDDPNLARACALLPACVSPSTPFAFIEVRVS